MKLIAYVSFPVLFMPLVTLSILMAVITCVSHGNNYDRCFAPITHYSNWILGIMH